MTPSPSATVSCVSLLPPDYEAINSYAVTVSASDGELD